MQSQQFNLDAGAVAGIQILGDFFAYESGSSAGSSALLVKPENGNEIILKPGQQFRVKEKAGRWFIRANDGASVIVGNVIIGEGEFFDSNTNSTVKLDAEFANNVYVNNTNAQAIPVAKQQLASVADLAPVVIGLATAALVSDPTLKILRIRNAHASATLTIGGAGVTIAKGAIKLAPGDLWIEEEAAGAAWYAISDTAATTVQLQGVK